MLLGKRLGQATRRYTQPRPTSSHAIAIPNYSNGGKQSRYPPGSLGPHHWLHTGMCLTHVGLSHRSQPERRRGHCKAVEQPGNVFLGPLQLVDSHECISQQVQHSSSSRERLTGLRNRPSISAAATLLDNVDVACSRALTDWCSSSLLGFFDCRWALRSAAAQTNHHSPLLAAIMVAT